MAVIWVGGGLMMQFFGMRAAMSGDPSRFATLGADIKWIADRVFIPASLLAFVSGILLVVESDFYGFGDDWIVIGLALYATTFLAGLLFLGPESGARRKLTGRGLARGGAADASSDHAHPSRSRRAVPLIYDMTVKPDFGDAASILWGVAGVAVAAGLVYWRYRVALAQGPAPAPAAPS